MRDRHAPRGLAADADARTRRGRVVAVVMAATMGVWLGLQALGAALGWPAGLAFVFDLAALGAFAWALIVTIGLWRRHREGSRDAP